MLSMPQLKFISLNPGNSIALCTCHLKFHCSLSLLTISYPVVAV